MSIIIDRFVSEFIKRTSEFRGKGRIVSYWMQHRDTNAKRVRILPGGNPIVCDLASSYDCMVWLAREEQEDLEILRHLLKPGQVFLDCGANIGIWSLVAASIVENAGKVYAFEPNPKTFQRFSENIALGQLTRNIQSFCLAVGNENTTLPFKCNDQHNISQIVDESASDQVISVPIVTIDSVLKETSVHGMKIDVEGFELEALKGSEAIIRRDQPWLCVEFNTLLAGVTNLKSWPVHQYLMDLGYVARQFNDALNLDQASILAETWETKGYLNLFYSIK